MQEPSGDHHVGKLPAQNLTRIISTLRRTIWPSTLIGPRIGEDAAYIDLGSCILVSHTDPITEASKEAGRLSVIVASNDIAVSGARPQWAQILILAPPNWPLESIVELANTIGLEADRLGIEIVGGHTERSPGIVKPIISLTVFGCACRECITPTGGAEPGDYVIQMGSAGMEGASIIASDFPELLLSKGFTEREVKYLRDLGERISVAELAVSLAENQLVTSMHDATEGGLIGALVEAAIASSNLFKIYYNKIIIDKIISKMSKKLNINPLKLISSGTLIATAKPSKTKEVIKIAREKGYKAAIIGEVVASDRKGVLLVGDRKETFINEVPPDEISKFWVSKS